MVAFTVGMCVRVSEGLKVEFMDGFAVSCIVGIADGPRDKLSVGFIE